MMYLYIYICIYIYILYRIWAPRLTFQTYKSGFPQRYSIDWVIQFVVPKAIIPSFRNCLPGKSRNLKTSGEATSLLPDLEDSEPCAMTAMVKLGWGSLVMDGHGTIMEMGFPMGKKWKKSSGTMGWSCNYRWHVIIIYRCLWRSVVISGCAGNGMVSVSDYRTNFLGLKCRLQLARPFVLRFPRMFKRSINLGRWKSAKNDPKTTEPVRVHEFGCPIFASSPLVWTVVKPAPFDPLIHRSCILKLYENYGVLSFYIYIYIRSMRIHLEDVPTFTLTTALTIAHLYPKSCPQFCS